MKIKQITIRHFPNTIVQLFRYAIVGSLGLLIDFSVTWILRDRLNFNDYFANAIGFSFAVISNYYFNSRWTFKIESKNVKRFNIFLVISIVGLVLNTSVVYLFLRLHAFFYMSKWIATIVVFIWNFIANKLITFNPKVR
jgi:putative flippase GtrA